MNDDILGMINGLLSNSEENRNKSENDLQVLLKDDALRVIIGLYNIIMSDSYNSVVYQYSFIIINKLLSPDNNISFKHLWNEDLFIPYWNLMREMCFRGIVFDSIVTNQLSSQSIIQLFSLDQQKSLDFFNELVMIIDSNEYCYNAKYASLKTITGLLQHMVINKSCSSLDNIQITCQYLVDMLYNATLYPVELINEAVCSMSFAIQVLCKEFEVGETQQTLLSVLNNLITVCISNELFQSIYTFLLCFLQQYYLSSVLPMDILRDLIIKGLTSENVFHVKIAIGVLKDILLYEKGLEMFNENALSFNSNLIKLQARCKDSYRDVPFKEMKSIRGIGKNYIGQFSSIMLQQIFVSFSEEFSEDNLIIYISDLVGMLFTIDNHIVFNIFHQFLQDTVFSNNCLDNIACMYILSTLCQNSNFEPLKVLLELLYTKLLEFSCHSNIVLSSITLELIKKSIKIYNLFNNEMNSNDLLDVITYNSKNTLDQCIKATECLKTLIIALPKLDINPPLEIIFPKIMECIQYLMNRDDIDDIVNNIYDIYVILITNSPLNMVHYVERILDDTIDNFKVYTSFSIQQNLLLVISTVFITYPLEFTQKLSIIYDLFIPRLRHLNDPLFKDIFTTIIYILSTCETPPDTLVLSLLPIIDTSLDSQSPEIILECVIAIKIIVQNNQNSIDYPNTIQKLFDTLSEANLSIDQIPIYIKALASIVFIMKSQSTDQILDQLFTHTTRLANFHFSPSIEEDLYYAQLFYDAFFFSFSVLIQAFDPSFFTNSKKRIFSEIRKYKSFFPYNKETLTSLNHLLMAIINHTGKAAESYTSHSIIKEFQIWSSISGDHNLSHFSEVVLQNIEKRTIRFDGNDFLLV